MRSGGPALGLHLALHTPRTPPTSPPLPLVPLFSPPLHSAQKRVRAGGGEDPTKTPVAAFADVLQNLLTNSPLNEGKKALARLTAGPYDRDAVGAKLDALIADEPVLMLSFVR